MIKYLILPFFFLLCIPSVAQKTISDYSYVIVPDQFEFLEGKDKYQLNSLTKYLFNKYGFNAYLSSETLNAKRCDGLYADLKESNSFLRTKLMVLLKDCNGNIVFTGKAGESKYKDYRKAYQDATRKAFADVRLLGVNQKEVVLKEKQSLAETNIAETSNTQKEVVNTNTAVKEEGSTKTERKSIKNVAVSNLPKAKFLNYSKNEASFLLRKTDKGYSLYEESTEAENGLALMGTIVVANSEVKFNSTKGEVYDVYFDENQNLSLFKGETVELYKLMR